MTPIEVASAVLVVAGAALAAVAGLGLLRFPDVLSRMHAATKPATLGLILVAAGTGLRLTTTGDLATLGLIVVLQLLTAPVGAHLVGRAVRRGAAAARSLDDVGSVAPEAGGGPGEPRGRGGPGDPVSPAGG